MREDLLRPRIMADYRREPYVYARDNVRLTFGSGIPTGLDEIDLLYVQLLIAPTGRPGIL